jgi:hypothetical protein
LPFLKQKALAKDMSLPYIRILESLNIRAHAWEPPLLKLFGFGYF